MITERDAWTINGYLGVIILTIMIGIGVLSFIYEEWTMSIIFFLSGIILSTGFTVIQPNQSVIVQFAGKYTGTYRQAGIVLFAPFSKRISVSLRERIFKNEISYVHDRRGIPRSMSIVLLFKVVDAAKAVYDVEDVEKYIAIQSEMSVRNLMIAYSHRDLLTDEALIHDITDKLKQELYDRLDRAGVALTESRLISTSSEEKATPLENPDQLTERIFQLMEKENLLPLNETKREVLKNKLTVSLLGE